MTATDSLITRSSENTGNTLVDALTLTRDKARQLAMDPDAVTADRHQGAHNAAAADFLLRVYKSEELGQTAEDRQSHAMAAIEKVLGKLGLWAGLEDGGFEKTVQDLPKLDKHERTLYDAAMDDRKNGVNGVIDKLPQPKKIARLKKTKTIKNRVNDLGYVGALVGGLMFFDAYGTRRPQDVQPSLITTTTNVMKADTAEQLKLMESPKAWNPDNIDNTMATLRRLAADQEANLKPIESAELHAAHNQEWNGTAIAALGLVLIGLSHVGDKKVKQLNAVLDESIGALGNVMEEVRKHERTQGAAKA